LEDLTPWVLVGLYERYFSSKLLGRVVDMDAEENWTDATAAATTTTARQWPI
jgi:hypothetical protein